MCPFKTVEFFPIHPFSDAQPATPAAGRKHHLHSKASGTKVFAHHGSFRRCVHQTVPTVARIPGKVISGSARTAVVYPRLLPAAECARVPGRAGFFLDLLGLLLFTLICHLLLLNVTHASGNAIHSCARHYRLVLSLAAGTLAAPSAPRPSSGHASTPATLRHPVSVMT